MRAVIQCVSSASVTVDSQVISSISRGLMVLVGLAHDDTQDDVDYIVRKLLNARLFADPDSGAMWKKSAKDLDLEVLCVSQFTLYGNVAKGNKPDFHASMKAEQARETYAGFLDQLRSGFGKAERIKDGRFQAMMQVALVNEGPITLTVDSRIRK